MKEGTIIIVNYGYPDAGRIGEVLGVAYWLYGKAWFPILWNDNPKELGWANKDQIRELPQANGKLIQALSLSLGAMRHVRSRVCNIAPEVAKQVDEAIATLEKI